MTSGYLNHLPAVFREDPFAGSFLLAFEAVLSGRDGVEGLEQIAGRIADHFDPGKTPDDFLPWLAGWVALSLRADWDAGTKRGFIAEIVPLYRKRGTLAGLKRMLEIYLRPLGDEVSRDDVVIYDDFDTPPHFFQVQLKLTQADPILLRTTQEIARAIIDQEKPAHTFYALNVVIPTMRLVSEKLRKAENNVPDLLMIGQNTRFGSTVVPR
jgi:phage tail-like protein